MMQVTQSPLLQALGFAIVNSLWQFALLWLIYYVITSLINLSSNLKHTAGIAMQIAGFSWFLGTLLFYYYQCVRVSSSVNNLSDDMSVAIAGNSSTSSKEVFLSWLFKTEQLLPYLSIAYLVLLTFLSVRWVQSYQYTLQVKNSRLQKIPVEWRLFVNKISGQLGINRTVKIYLSEFVKTPLTIGYLKPFILIPIASINHLSTDQLEAVILHELAHIKRMDFLINLALSIIETILFFNPFMQLLSRHIKRERENCCDDWVLQYNYNACNYAKALLHLASQQVLTPSFAMHATTKKHDLLHRVKRMIEKKERSLNYAHQLMAMLFITLILVGISWVTPPKKQSEKIGRNPSKPKTSAPIVSTVDNLLFNPVSFLARDVMKEDDEFEIEIKKNVVRLHSIPATIVTKDNKVTDGTNLSWSTNLPPQRLPIPIPPPAPKFSFEFFNNDTLTYNRFFETGFSKNALADMVKASSELHKLIKIYKPKINRVSDRNDEEISFHWKKSAEDIKKAKAELQNQKIIVEKSTTAYSDQQKGLRDAENQMLLLEYAKKEIQLLNEQIEKEKELLNRHFSMANKANDAPLHFSNMVYKIADKPLPVNHNYSFDYHESPQVKIRIERRKGCPENQATSETQEIIITSNGEEKIIKSILRSPEVEDEKKQKSLKIQKKCSIIRI